MREESLTQLHQVLPTLAHCKIAAGRQWGGNEQPEASPCCRSLLTCTTLTSLDFYDSMPTPDVWRELPPGLRDLRCMLSATPPESLVFGNLRSLQCNCGPAANCVLLEDIAAVLRMAPKLEVLNLVSGEASLESMLERPFAPAIEVCVQASTVSDLVYLHGRVSSGLAVTSALYTGGDLPGFTLDRCFEEDDEFGVAEYLATLPTFDVPGAFTGLILRSYSLPCCFPSIAKVAAARFPQVTTLVIKFDDQTLGTKDLKHLVLFPAVQRLSLQNADLTGTSLAILCSRMASLTCLQVCSQDFSVSDGELLQDVLHESGVDVCVRVIDW